MRPALFAAAAILAAAPVAAQNLSSLSGSVTNTSGTPIERARVMVMTADESDTLAVLFTNASGLFADEFATNVAVEELPPTPANGYALTAVYPNPAAGGGTTVHVEYVAPRGQATPQVELFDVLGRRVNPDASLGSGLYFIRLRFEASGRDALSEARSLVIASPGNVDLALRLDDRAHSGLDDSGSDGGDARAIADAAGSAATATKRSGESSAASSANAIPTLIRVEKPGFVTHERSVEVNPQSPAAEDFELDEATAPTASFTVGGTLQAGAAVLFDASDSSGASGEQLSYTWEFGDALMGGGGQIAHVYTEGGSFDVTLTVIGAHGATASTTQQIDVTPGDPPLANNATLSGLVSDVSGFALGDVEATIVGTELTAATNPFGAVALQDVPVGVPLAIRLERDGYAAQVIQVGIAADTSTTLYFEAAMRARDAAIEIADAENGFMKRSRDGVMVDIPFDALMRPDSTMATGPVQVAMTPVDVTDIDEVRTFPGRFAGVRPTGNEALLLSLGTAEYAFEQNGEPLQLAPGKTARVEIPIYTSEAAVGDTIPLWSMNETTGTWIEEGVGVVEASASSPSGLILAGEVSHFTWWNIDKFDEDPDEAEGLCYKYECFNGICNKVKVFCWVEGARRGDTDKRSQLDPPVFSARQYFPAEGAQVDLPGGVEVTLRGSVVLDTVVLRGDTTFTAVAGGNSQFELVLDTAFVATVGYVQLPFDTVGTFMNAGELDVMEFDGTAGQVMGYRATRLSGPSIPASVELQASDGTVISSRSVDNNVIPVMLPADDTYRFIVTATQSVAASYRLRVETVSGSVQVNSNTTLPLSSGEFRILQFQPVEGSDLIVGGYAPDATRRANLLVYDGELGPIGAAFNSVDSGPFTAGAGTHYLFVNGIPATQTSVRFGLSEVHPNERVQLYFDSHGAVDVATSFPYHGTHRYYSFDVPPGEGFEISVHRSGVGLENADFRMYDDEGDLLFLPLLNSGWNETIVFGWADALPYTGPFTLDVFDDRFASTGGFDIRLRKVTPSQNIVVDDDLSCPGAQTSSIAAGLHAAPENATIFVCNGEYDSPSRLELFRDGVTVEGESEEGVVLRFGDMNRSPGNIFDVRGRDVTIRNLTLQPPVTPNNRVTGGFRSPVTLEGNVLTIEDVTIEPEESATGSAVGFGIEGSYESVVVHNVTHVNGLSSATAFDLRASESILVEDSRFENVAYLRRSGNENTRIHVTNTTFDDASLNMQNAAFGLIEGSVIDGRLAVTFSDKVVIRNNEFSDTQSFAGEAISVVTTDTSLVESNTMHQRIAATVGAGQYAEITRNRIYPGTNPEMMTLTHIHNETGGTIVATSNVIEGLRASGGNVRIYYPDLFGDLFFGNNTVMPEQTGNTVETVPTVGMTLRDNAFTGELPMHFVNNIFVGDGTTVFFVPSGTSIDADYNLYHNYVHTVSAAGTNRTGTNDLTGDPLLTGADLQVQAGSPAIDSGAGIGMFPWLPLFDFGGTTRPQGAGYDRGAWEQ